MLEKELGTDIPLEKRESFLRDNCDEVEEVSYSRAFSPAELAERREKLTDASIKIADIQEQKKEAVAHFKEQLKTYEQQRDEAISNLRDKSQLVTEDCFKFLDEETKMIGFYNKQGQLVSSRPAFQNELQKTVYSIFRKEGTNN